MPARRSLPGVLAIAATALGGCGSAPAQSEEPTSVPSLAGDVSMVPAAPIAGRMSHIAFWSGNEMIIWGGVAAGPGESVQAVADGAAYDPGTRTWRRIADAPIAGRTFSAHVWTGTTLYVWGGDSRRDDVSAGEALADGAAYEPATDTWSVLPPAPIDARYGATAAWTGDELLVWGGTPSPGSERQQPDGAALDPSTQTWRPLPAAPLRSFYEFGSVWTGTELVVLAVGQRDNSPVGVAYDPASDSWRELAPGPLASGWALDLEWDGSRVLSVYPFDDKPARGGTTVAAAYDPVADTWESLPTITWEGGIQNDGVWTGSAVAYWAGNRAGGSAYLPAEGRWIQLPGGPDGQWREFPSTVWTGAELISWGGSQCPANASCAGLAARNDGVALRLE